MPHIGISPAQEEQVIQNRRLGSQLFTMGWIFLAMAGLAGFFVFQDIREGTKFMLVGASSLGVIGLALIVAGTVKRRQM
jgi:hypothetical protein